MPTSPTSNISFEQPQLPKIILFPLIQLYFSARQRFSLTHTLSVHYLSLPRERELPEGRFSYLQHAQCPAHRRRSYNLCVLYQCPGKHHAPPMVFYLTHSTCYINKFTLVDLYYYTFFTLQFSVIFSPFTCNQPLTSRCLPIISTKKPTVYENYVLLFEECLYSPGQPLRGIPWTP